MLLFDFFEFLLIIRLSSISIPHPIRLCPLFRVCFYIILSAILCLEEMSLLKRMDFLLLLVRPDLVVAHFHLLAVMNL